MLQKIRDGRTDLVFEFVQQGNSASSGDSNGVTLIQWCAYYGDVSAVRLLLEHGANIETLGGNLGLTAAVFHGHALPQFAKRPEVVKAAYHLPGIAAQFVVS